MSMNVRFVVTVISETHITKTEVVLWSRIIFAINCGFADEMAYSPGYTTFVKGGKFKDRFRRWKVRWKNWKKTLRVMLGDDFSAKLGKYI